MKDLRFPRVALLALGLVLVQARTKGQVFTEFPGGSSPNDIVTGPDGNVWFTEFKYDAAIGRISTDGVVTEFPIPNRFTNLAGIAAGPDGNLWFTAADFDIGSLSLICRITPAGVITEFPLSALSAPCDITAGPDGNLWFTECNINGNAIGRITPAGAIREFPLPTSGMGYYPLGITAGPDGNLWFTEPYVNKIGRITTGGVITEFAAAGSPGYITSGPDGNLWFTEPGSNKIGRITTAGVITTFPIPTNSSNPRRIVVGPDGNLWFTERAGNRIGRITTEGVVTEFEPPTAGGEPLGITVGPDGGIWFTEYSKNQIGRIDLTSTCAVDALCLAGGRFRVAVDWLSPTSSGRGQPVPLTPNAGYFWFFESSNIEVVVKVLDGCGSNGRKWVFVAGLTNLRVVVTVTDTRTRHSRTYSSPQGAVFLPILDTDALPTCP